MTSFMLWQLSCCLVCLHQPRGALTASRAVTKGWLSFLHNSQNKSFFHNLHDPHSIGAELHIKPAEIDKELLEMAKTHFSKVAVDPRKGEDADFEEEIQEVHVTVSGDLCSSQFWLVSAKLTESIFARAKLHQLQMQLCFVWYGVLSRMPSTTLKPCVLGRWIASSQVFVVLACVVAAFGGQVSLLGRSLYIYMFVIDICICVLSQTHPAHSLLCWRFVVKITTGILLLVTGKLLCAGCFLGEWPGRETLAIVVDPQPMASSVSAISYSMKTEEVHLCRYDGGVTGGVESMDQFKRW